MLWKRQRVHIERTYHVSENIEAEQPTWKYILTLLDFREKTFVVLGKSSVLHRQNIYVFRIKIFSMEERRWIGIVLKSFRGIKEKYWIGIGIIIWNSWSLLGFWLCQTSSLLMSFPRCTQPVILKYNFSLKETITFSGIPDSRPGNVQDEPVTCHHARK